VVHFAAAASPRASLFAMGLIHGQGSKLASDLA